VSLKICIVVANYYTDISKKLLNQCQEFVKSNLSEWRMLDADSSVMLVTSQIVGNCSGLGAVLFRLLIEWFQS